jgi:mannitol/fructose-specific phosphotransferase system IIA component (Ntr-type)
VTREVTGRGAKKPFKNREFFSSLRRAAIVGTVIEPDNFALVPKPPSAIEKAEPGAKRVLSGMVADTLALVKKVQRPKPRIVVVDDESVVLHFIESFIRDWFKDVTLLLYSNSSEAWQELSLTAPDLLILNTPSGGPDLLPLLAERKVKFPILVTSGYFGEKEVRQRIDPILNISVLLKPFLPEQLFQELLVHVGPSDNPQRRFSKSHPISILFSSEHIIPNLKSKERFGAIREMVTHLIYIGRIRPQDEEAVVDAINKRETSMSTGIGFSFAVPRGRVDCVKDIILAVGVSASGIEFDALDKQPVYVSFMSIVPANSPSHEAELERVTQALARFLFTNDGVGQLRRCNSPEGMWSILKPVYDDALQTES